MQLHTLKNKNRKNKKRVGRGGKRGTTSGKGQKGQKSRAGHRIRPATRDLVLRIPKKRGHGKNKNKPKSLPAFAISLDTLQKMQETKITPALLIEKRLLRDPRRQVKIVATGTITAAKEIEGISASAAARAKIEQAGGKVTPKGSS
ncbi:hypothetical protein A2755_01835 [Candidatus Wolfebacteria bacterium RIFCSPHIGHO2_01_FULL_48_22]|uniref:Large ribosomal subunit protein uL15 n=2 Tax=Candidatus Wolfeibacteriota TaxID=1752735 RepID=A0A1F8DQL5_9BACT|nr:MAG: hypothetical protein A2755_01835 [Candidatus Wolfebacteria bacterium RIFCSPHIGHO2_01_FULL_48_22]OGM91974.1 MAG: hypothetical protein A2935_02475 [Candidatus Wolfebacteria bacterium RIFCSPLOWO2_01_FULL_47_17b]